MENHRLHWGLPQWIAYLREKEIPIMPRSKLIIEALAGEDISPRELAGIVMCDPFLSLRLLRRAEHRRSSTLGHDTTTILGAVQQVGLDGLLATAAESVLCDENIAGLLPVSQGLSCLPPLRCTGRETGRIFRRRRWLSRPCWEKSVS